MEKIKVDGLLCNEIIIRMDNELVGKLKKHARENDMTLSAIIRRSLRLFFKGVEESNPSQKLRGEK